MSEENTSQESRLKNIDQTRNYLVEKVNRNNLVSEKQKNVCTTLNYFLQVIVSKICRTTHIFGESLSYEISL